MGYKVLKYRKNKDEQKSHDKNRWLSKVVKLNPNLFTKEDKSTNNKKWERYKEIRNIGLKIKMPKNSNFGRLSEKQKTEKQLKKELGSIEFYKRKKAGELP